MSREEVHLTVTASDRAGVMRELREQADDYFEHEHFTLSDVTVWVRTEDHGPMRVITYEGSAIAIEGGQQ